MAASAVAIYFAELGGLVLGASLELGAWSFALRRHSCLNASTGSILAARKAGYRPKTTPTSAEMLKASSGDQKVMIVFIPAVCATIEGMAMPSKTPMIPPAPA